MAERRMFAKSIVTSDAFLDMPCEAQALYLQLNMAADDWGAVGNPRAIMRICGASDDSMRLLIKKKFVLTFEKEDNLIAVIKHWNQHNYIRSDRKNESKFKEVFRGMYLDENNNYSMNPENHVRLMSGTCPSSDCQVTDICQADDGQSATQVRLGKDRLDKDSIGEIRKDKDISINDNADTDGEIESYNERLRYLVRKGDVGLAMSLYRLYQSDGFNTINPEEYANELKG